MTIGKVTTHLCFYAVLLIVQTTANPWHQPKPLLTPPKLPSPPLALQESLVKNLSSNILEILFSFKGFGNATSCSNKISQLTSGVLSSGAESIAFLDALGKPGPGITTGNFLWLGDYDMCGKGVLGNETVGGIYQNCAVAGYVYFAGFPFSLTWTGCSPPECQNTTDLQGVLKQIADLINKSGFIKTDAASWSVQCDVEQELDAGAYAAVMIISLFVLLVVVGTLWHLLEPIIMSFNERKSDDTSVLVQAEENIYDGVDTKTNSGELKEKYQITNQPESFLARFVKCFALQRTMKTLTSTDTKPGQILCLNGIRVLSINWVVLGHTYGWAASFVGGYTYLQVLLQRRSFTFVSNGLPSVDSFFVLSGFLVTYLLLKQLAKSGMSSPLHWVTFYVHRYVRLTTPYLVAMLLEGWLYKLMVSGPTAQQVMDSPQSAHEACTEYWYLNLLYINNIVPWNATIACVGQGWYLANDMQFFIIAPLFIVLLFRKHILGVAVILGTMLCSVITAAVITAHYHLGPAATAEIDQGHEQLLYTKPWIRITPYLVGILAGWFYWKHGEKVSVKVKTLPDWVKVVVSAPLWMVTAAVEYAVVFGLYDDIQHVQTEHTNPSEVSSVFYESFARIGWSLALIIQVLLCQCGLGGFINSLLSWSGWLVISRLTYSVFLLHLGLLPVLSGQMRHAIFLNPDFEFAVLYLGILAIAYLSAAVLYLVVEQPIANLEGMTYRKTK